MKRTQAITRICALTLGLCCATANAQVAPDAGSTLREQQKPTLEVPKRRAPALQVDEPARPALAPSAVRFVLREVRFSGNTVFGQAELAALVLAAVGKSVGFADLDALTATVAAHYRDGGYLVARAYLPRQDIQNGVIEIAVIEGRIGGVSINNPSRVRDSVMQQHTAALPGAPVQAPALERKLLLLSDLAGVADVRGGLRPGAQVGETDLAIEATAAPLISGSVEYDNYGNRFAGSDRLTGRVNLASPLGLGDLFSARYTRGFNGLDYARLGYQIPLGGDGLALGASYINSRYELGDIFAPLLATGESDTYGLNASYPLIRSRTRNLALHLNHDRSDFEDRVGATNTISRKSTRVTTLGLAGDVTDRFMGGGITVAALRYSSGNLDIGTPAARAIDAASARTQGSYHKWNLNLVRLQNLTARTSLYVSYMMQTASKNLDSSEKFVLGGANGVRAYPQGEGAGDSGQLASIELRYALAHWMGATPSLVLFVDHGESRINKNPFAAGNNQRRLGAAGIGLMLVKRDDYSLRLHWAVKTSDERATAGTDRGDRAWLQLTKAF